MRRVTPSSLRCGGGRRNRRRDSGGGTADQEIYVTKIPSGYRDWRLVSVAHEAGEINDIRAILGNDVAVKAYRDEQASVPRRRRHRPHRLELRPIGGEQQGLRPRPVLRSGRPLPTWYLQFMVKDSKKYAATGGWGYAQFDKDGKPGPEKDLKACFPCHEAIKTRDFLFTKYTP